MDKKLTLSLNASIIENAKKYAYSNQISLSKLIESYLASLIERNNSKAEITPLVKSLSGVIELSDNSDYRKEYMEYLVAKYK